MLESIMELFLNLVNGLFKLLFGIYILVLIAMGFIAPGYLVWEVVAMIVGFIIYKCKGNCFGHGATFPIVWMNATMACFLFFIFGAVGAALAPIGRLLFIAFAYK